jgi:predicted aspartyl protease
MSHFRVSIEIGDAGGQRFERMDALVDTGATYTFVPRSTLKRLGHTPEEQWEFELADGRRVPYDIAWVPIRLNGQRARSLPVVFGDEDAEPLLGVFTLEGFR